MPQWPIYIPPFSVIGKPEKIGELVTFTSAPQNLLSVNSPTIMERWELTSLYLPLAVSYQFGSESPTETEAEKVRSLVIPTLRLGGDIVYSKPLALQVGITPFLGFPIMRANGEVGEPFNSPIIVERGRTLTLELALQVSGLSKASNQVQALASQQYAPNGETLRREGNILYDIAVLSGHRTL
jgi:hypothetical protein